MDEQAIIEEWQGLQESRDLLLDALKERGLEGQVFFQLDPVTLELDISITSYGLAQLLGLGCDHEWVSARNEVILSGEYCILCNEIRGEKETLTVKTWGGEEWTLPG